MAGGLRQDLEQLTRGVPDLLLQRALVEEAVIGEVTQTRLQPQAELGVDVEVGVARTVTPPGVIVMLAKVIATDVCLPLDGLIRPSEAGIVATECPARARARRREGGTRDTIDRCKL
jgi:hypothetical protein